MQRIRVVVGALVALVALTGCAQALISNQAAPSAGLPRATRGIEPTAGAVGQPIGSPAAVEPTVAGGAVQPTAIPDAQPTTVPDAQPTAAPVPPAPAADPTVNPALANVQLPTAADLEQRWREMQVQREPFDAPRTFVSPGFQVVWWFDPLFGQIVPIGELRGEFVAQARFRIKGQWIGALELPYNVNQMYEITVPDPILKRMQAAGKGEWAEVFIYQTKDIQEK